MPFKQLIVKNWRQFDTVKIDFDDRLTVIAGSNGAGKSTLLRILSLHFGFSFDLISTPTLGKSGVFRYLNGAFGRSISSDVNWDTIGELTYSSGHSTGLTVPRHGQPTYSVRPERAEKVAGLFINSHRPQSNYQSISSIPTNAINAAEAYQIYSQEMMQRFNNSFSQYSPIYRIKEAIISMATFGPGNQNVQRNPELERNFEQFKSILRKVLPENIGFKDISIRIPDVVLVTATGEFVLDASSGGLMSIIDLAWQMFLYSRDRDEFVAVIDEPENHLHPSMQRIVISNLLDAFPKAQLIVATHSPFVVTSVREATVYVLRYRSGEEYESGRNVVVSERLDSYDKAGTASETLRNVLGVPVTMPLWAERELSLIVNDLEISNLNSETLQGIRLRLRQAGLEDFLPEAIGKISKKND